jgi:hypothetical protein
VASLENGENEVRTIIAWAALLLRAAVGGIAMKLKISGMLAIATFGLFWLLGSVQSLAHGGAEYRFFGAN